MNTSLAGISAETLKAFMKIALGMVVIFGAYVGYGMYREPIAEADAKRFCASIKVGDPSEGLPEKALAAGAETAFAKWADSLDKRVTSKERHLSAIFTGAPPFSRHICEIPIIIRTYEILRQRSDAPASRLVL
ncbi:hypothetical protein QN397_15565 [Variovorax sp. RTB1]|uniref:hypothetical protein n=1 Tax=Variovorax sp. RTB1 TaxID=3048631 RepID=UPI002B234195|nr:hypothetical protein [Variovorax sp. RTB1]MEB0112776.1 hypothetical protein [Variovorax sp. RTB1]